MLKYFIAKEKPKAVVKKTTKVETKKEVVAQTSSEKTKRILTINPLVSEKAVMMIESQNIITFEADRNATKHEIQREIEDLFNVKVDAIRTLNAKNKKHAYVKLNSKFPEYLFELFDWHLFGTNRRRWWRDDR